jgi:hypothetical protein
MKALPLIFWAAASSALFAGDWQEKLTTAPGDFAPLKPLTAKYTFGWSAFNAGHAEAEFSRSSGDQYQLHIKGTTTGAVRALWRLDADATSTVRPGILLPSKVVQHETYSDESRVTTVEFNSEGLVRTRERKPAEKGPSKAKRFKFAPVHDLHSALLFIRSQPLKDGDVLRFVVYPAAQAYLAEVTVTGHETIKAAGRKWSAVKLDLKLQEIEKDFTLAPHKKFKKAAGWISDDADRILLKVESEVMVGKVWMELEQVKFAPTMADAAGGQPQKRTASTQGGS